MTISNTPIPKPKSNLKLELTGSQINLSPRPIPVTHLALSSSYRTYPMRRSVSAFGFQPKDDDENSKMSSRPQSADNIRYANEKNFNSDFHNSNIDACISTSTQGLQKCDISENEFDNIINGYSEKQDMSVAENETASSLKPGLSSKPPLPFSVDQKNAKNDAESGGETQLKKIAMKTVAEQEAFDEIIALKFQRWFPNTAVSVPEGSSSEDDSNNNLEVLSYREHKFQTCEYSYEVLKKNNKSLTFDKHKSQTGFKNNKLKSKKCNARVKTKVFRSRSSLADADRGTVSANEANEPDESDGERRDIMERGCDGEAIATEYVNTIQLERNTESILEDTDPLQLLAEQDLLMLRAKQYSKCVDTTDRKYASKLAKKTVEPKTKIVKNSFLKASSSSPYVNPYKKQKKISFLVDRRGSEQSKTNKDDFDAVSPGRETDSALRSAEGRGAKPGEHSRNTANDVLREMAVSPQQPAGSQIEDVLSWMGSHRPATPRSKMTTPETERSCSMYEEIVDILKDIEKEDINGHSHKSETPSRFVGPSTSAKAIWTLLDEAEKTIDIDEDPSHSIRESNRSPDNVDSSRSGNVEESKNRTRLSDLLRYPNTELAQKVMALQLLLDERETTLHNLNAQCKTNEQQHQQQKQELEYALNKQQRLAEQLKLEKRASVEKLEIMIKEMERKHTMALQAQEDKFKVELKKSLEKQAAADKLEREKWMETKTHKIKELAVKGLEPELNRMAAAHQEEIGEIRKFHKRQLEELDEAWNRRMSVQREKMEADKEKALAIEREMSRQKLEDEIGELEKRYQEQRKRLLAEVHVERENIERVNEATLAIREKENERKWEMKSIEMQKKIESLQLQHQEEIQKLHQNLETEKQIWIKNQTMEQLEKENRYKEQNKKERDKHIELIIQKLENENTEREQASEQKIKRLKEQYETEINDLEAANENLRRKLNESRSEIEKCEDAISQLRAQLNQSHAEFVILKEKYDRLSAEQSEMQNMAKSELSTKIHILQSELNQAQLTYESQIKSLKSENERELSQMYNRVKEMIMKKDDSISVLKKQKDAALEQCNQLEKLLDMKRKDVSAYR